MSRGEQKAPDQSGRQLGNYKLKKLLGHGGFADVYLGEHIHLGTQAAIKILHAQLIGEEIENFRAEGQTIAHLNHPHIVRVLDFDIEQQTPFLVMEYAPNGNLRQRHPKGTRVPAETILSYVKQMASALQYAHNKKLIHRDVKPENMLISANNTLVLSDFGIALLAKSTGNEVALDDETQRNVVGTMAYMPPEQIQGHPVLASDQYSLAITIYEWLTGSKPFKGTYFEVISQQISSPPPVLNPSELHIPPAVSQVVMKGLNKDPRQRYRSIEEFARAFELALHPPIPLPFGMGFSPRLTTAPRKVGKGLKRGLIALGVSLALCAILACGLSFAGVNLVKSVTSIWNSGPSTSQDIQQATIVSNDFMQAIESHNYNQAYAKFTPSLASQLPRDQFIQQSLQQDRCEGNIVGFSQLNSSGQSTRRDYIYIVNRQKLAKYNLSLTLQKDSQGNWQVSDFSVPSATPACG
ncbi:MAG TPA: serine/threonine-protein kinase [Ktedonobacteraceae bacterium]|nr:serine/threonine-protein kinase [Ktedonobacteraceae bacterium]